MISFTLTAIFAVEIVSILIIPAVALDMIPTLTIPAAEDTLEIAVNVIKVTF